MREGVRLAHQGVRLDRAARRWRGGAALLWPAGLLTAPVLVAMDGPPLCLFLRITGWPCPLCGGTHACAALAAGDWASAWQANPGVVPLVALAGVHAGLLAGEALTGQRLLSIPGGMRGLSMAWQTGIGILMAAWGFRLITLA